jgi:hypothetical protein
MNNRAHETPESTHDSNLDHCDVDVRFVSGSALGLIAVCAIALLGLTWFLSTLESFANRKTAPTNSPDAKQMPPQPRLQPDPSVELEALRKSEKHRLATYGWTDRKNQVVRIPIDRAIQLLAERGLPEPEGPVESPPAREVQK